MSYFDDASLVMIPSGYKTSKVYSVKPTDGSGDLTFTRSNDTATRVGPDGLIEKVRTNQVLQSETFDNAYWSKINVSITANAIANPLDGALTADLLTVTNPAGPVEKTITNAFQSYTAGTPYTISAYFKAGTISTNFRILAFDGVTLYQSGVIDLATIGNSTAAYQDVGNGWYRFRFTFTPANSTATGLVYLVNYAFGVAANAGTNVYVYGAQIERGDIATDYIATTSAAVSVGPVANVPRLDYLNSSCPRLLLEPQRTNLRTYSERFSSLSPSNVTVTSNDTTSPDGYTNADKLTPSGSGFHTVGNSISVTAGQKYTISVFYKYGTHKNIGFYDNNTAGSEITINMETNAFTLGPSVEAGGVVPYGNGWYRAYATFTAGSSDMVNYIIFRDNTNNGNYTGDGSYSWFYGWQVEAGTYATSYIPTLGAAVTRGADAASKTGISSLIGQTEGTLYAEFDVTLGVNGGEYFLSDGTNVIGIQFPAASPNTIRAIIYNGGSFPVVMDYIYSTAGSHKVAYAYKANDFVLYVDGVQRASDTSGTVPACSIVQFGGAQNVASALVFKTRLSNADLAALTA